MTEHDVNLSQALRSASHFARLAKISSERARKFAESAPEYYEKAEFEAGNAVKAEKELKDLENNIKERRQKEDEPKEDDWKNLEKKVTQARKESERATAEATKHADAAESLHKQKEPYRRQQQWLGLAKVLAYSVLIWVVISALNMPSLNQAVTTTLLPLSTHTQQTSEKIRTTKSTEDAIFDATEKAVKDKTEALQARIDDTWSAVQGIGLISAIIGVLITVLVLYFSFQNSETINTFKDNAEININSLKTSAHGAIEALNAKEKLINDLNEQLVTLSTSVTAKEEKLTALQNEVSSNSETLKILEKKVQDLLKRGESVLNNLTIASTGEEAPDEGSKQQIVSEYNQTASPPNPRDKAKLVKDIKAWANNKDNNAAAKWLAKNCDNDSIFDYDFESGKIKYKQE